MSKISRALSELQIRRGLMSGCTDSALRMQILAKINEVERLAKAAKRESPSD